MQTTNKDIVIITTPKDNVGIVVNPLGLAEGTVLQEGTVVVQFVPSGHKVALCDIAVGKEIIRYAEIIGYANKLIKRGEWIEESKMSLPNPPELQFISLPEVEAVIPKIEPLDGYTFQGYRNADGSVGTKNILGIIFSNSLFI